MQSSYEGFGKAVKRILKADADWKRGICGAVAELIHVEDPFITAIETALEHREALNLSGGLLMSDGRVDGFTYGTLVAKDIFAVHIEKARRDVTGAYPALSSAFAKSLPEDVVFLNREEDIGIPGLRKAKLAWMPCGMIQKGVVEIVPAN